MKKIPPQPTGERVAGLKLLGSDNPVLELEFVNRRNRDKNRW
jgi:hypothetical protein